MHYAWAGREAAVLWRTLCPQVWCFLCVSVPICIQPRCKTHSLPGPLLLQESDGASDNKQHRLRLQTGCWGLRLSGGADGSHCCREAVWVVSAVKHLAALIFLLTHKTTTVTALELLSVRFCTSVEGQNPVRWLSATFAHWLNGQPCATRLKRGGPGLSSVHFLSALHCPVKVENAQR